MAVSAPRACPIRQRVVRTDPGNQKLTNAEHLVVFDGRRGLPVTKPRFLPADLALRWPASSPPGASAPCRRSEGGVSIGPAARWAFYKESRPKPT